VTAAKILIVENDELAGQYLRRELLKMNFEVCAIYPTGEMAVAQLLQHKPDLILMDISLDGALDGIETAAQIAAIRPTPHVYLSGYTDEMTLARARKTKPHGYLVKPYDEPTLRATLQMLLERLQTERALRESEARLHEAALVFEATQDGILILNAEHTITNTNRRFSDITGFDADDVLGMNPAFLNFDELTPALFEHTDRYAGRWSGQIEVTKKDGSRFPGNVTIARVQRESQTAQSDCDRVERNYVVLISDLTAIRMAEDKLYRMAHHDPLTGLPNRQLAMDRLHHAIEQSKRRRSRMAVFFVDLDNFKRINDSLGHDAGDDLLRTVATRMQACVRSVDTVARLGGDEFLVILDSIDDIKTVSAIAQKMLDTLSAPIKPSSITSNHVTAPMSASASIGISLFPETGTTPDHLIRAADTAMYHAKARGRCTYSFYTPRMKHSEAQRAEFNAQLRAAVEQQQLELHYLPQVSMAEGTVIGLEALLRWRHPHKGLLNSEPIITLAEAGDYMVELNRWVLRSVCAQLNDWQNQQLHIVKVAINIDHCQLFDRGFIAVLEECLNEFHIAPELLEFEITEATLSSEKAQDAVFEQLSRLGVSLAIDHFGTGYSSVNTLKKLPIRRIKIDQQFVHDATNNRAPDSSAPSNEPGNCGNVLVTNAILAMIKELNLIPVAEGVETCEQEVFMRTHGCSEAQGFFYSGALPAHEVQRMLNTVPAAALSL
jgi:diguanylate cyclase (GGDEF)-like protein/PAS domain S-box-containing protein